MSEIYGILVWSDKSDESESYDESSGPSMSVLRLMRDLSRESVEAGFVPSVVMCAACGEKPAESRNESVFALCPDCCESIYKHYMAEFGTIEMVHAVMSEKFGYDMMDAELSKMFD